ncbi:unnamed protein product [Prunus brigantina]
MLTTLYKFCMKLLILFKSYSFRLVSLLLIQRLSIIFVLQCLLLFCHYRDAFWHGMRSVVYRKDALQLLNEKAVSIQVMNSFLEILNGDKMAIPRGQLKSCFMPTFGWELVKWRDEIGKVAVHVEVVLKNLRNHDLLFFPIIHVKEEHFTFADSGVSVMYMSKTLFEGKTLESVFPNGAMKNKRAHVLGKFINDEDGCWDAYRIN